MVRLPHWTGAASVLCACAAPCPAPAPPPKTVASTVAKTAAPGPVLEMRAAWDEFEETLRGAYAYVDRDDFALEPQVTRSRQLALQASDAEAFAKDAQGSGISRGIENPTVVGP